MAATFTGRFIESVTIPVTTSFLFPVAGASGKPAFFATGDYNHTAYKWQ
jgi:hypothetical protein